jgi:uncharacterized membrane protein (UPF0127 family)
MTFLQPLLREPATPWMLASQGGLVIAPRVEAAFDSETRRRGLLGRDGLEDTALVIAPCNAVHTWFMRFAIDVLFVSRSGAIVAMRRAVPPWRIAVGWRAFATIELPAGTIDRVGLREGDQLAIKPIAA